MIPIHPDHYHGRNKKAPFFEGWYYRLTTADGRRRLAVIPGIYRHENPAENRSFIIVFDAVHRRSFFVPFSFDAFHCPEGMNVSLDRNSFDRDAFSLDIHNEGLRLQGTVAFSTAVRWPSYPFSPGVMGPYTRLPVMECYYQVTNMDGRLEGSLTLNGEDIDFTGGRGYIEKNWGSSFPSAWTWLQSNHFESQSDAAFLLSVAHIPFPSRSFTGITGGVYSDGRFHRIASFRGAKLDRFTLRGDQHVEIRVVQRRIALDIKAHFRDGTRLPAPTTAGMTGHVLESLSSRVEVTLSRDGRKLFSGTSELAGMELSNQAADLATARA